MFPRMGTYYLTHRVDPAQGAEPSPRRKSPTTAPRASSDPQELGMCCLAAAAVWVGALLMWIIP